jgi:hypothetical protein
MAECEQEVSYKELLRCNKKALDLQFERETFLALNYVN